MSAKKTNTDTSLRAEHGSVSTQGTQVVGKRSVQKKYRAMTKSQSESPNTADFFERVWDIVVQIPRGKVTTYGHIAKVLGAKSSSRMVGWAMNAAHSREWIPAHRVVNRLGELSGKMHFATPTLMRELLEAEDVSFDGDQVIMMKHLWIPPEQLV